MPKLIIFILLISNSFAIFCQQPNVKKIMDLKQGKIKIDTSYIYQLPFELGTKRRVVQAAYSKLSHKGEIALDFNVKIGTTICAARGGVVTAAYGGSNKGGVGNAYINDGNYVIIQHEDGSKAMYWHLQYNGVLVKEGDTVITGQKIGKSGNTGYSAFPHLHFEINAFTANGSYTQVPARFYTNKGIVYLRPLKKYKVVKSKNN
jgi:murein DD-endopeptidase MepM/ murein hydrolase activator NlpD